MSLKSKIFSSILTGALVITSIAPAVAAPSTRPPNGDVTPKFTGIDVGDYNSGLNIVLGNVGLDDVVRVLINGIIVAKGGVIDLSQTGFNDFIVNGVQTFSSSSERSTFKLSERTDLEIHSCASFPGSDSCGVIKGTYGNISFDSFLEVLGSIALYSTDDSNLRLYRDENNSGTISPSERHSLTIAGPRSDSGTNSQVWLRDIDLIATDGTTIQSRSVHGEPIQIQSDVKFTNGAWLDIPTIKNTNTSGLGTLILDDNVTVNNSLIVRGDYTSLQNLLVSDRIITSPGGSIGSYQKRWTTLPMNDGNGYEADTVGQLDVACPTDSILISCNGWVQEASESTYTSIDSDYLGSQMLYGSNTCRSRARRVGNSANNSRHYTEALCFSISGAVSGDVEVAPISR
jgi:hypothetical protein